MWRSLILCLLITHAGLAAECLRPPVKLNVDDSRIQAVLHEVHAHLAKKREEEAIPGISAAIVYGKQIIWQGGFGFANVEKKEAADENTIYPVGGMTKPFTATMLMQLRDAHKLHLDDPITDFMSSFQIKGCPAGYEVPTLLQLASHLSGLPHSPQVDYWGTEDSLSEIDILKSLPETEMVLDVQRAGHYSHLAYVVLAHALSLVAEQPYEEYIKQHIFKPLKMNNSAFKVTPTMHTATGYVASDDGSIRAVPPPKDWGGLTPAFGLFTSVRDMARFISLQLSNTPREKPEILAGASLRQMQGPNYIFPGWNRASGIGWFLWPQGKYTSIGHRGAAPGFEGEIRFIPELNLGVIVFTNLDPGKRWMGITASRRQGKAADVLGMVLPAVASVLEEQEKAWLREKGKGDLSAVQLEEYTGTFRPEEGQSFFRPITIGMEEGGLTMTMWNVTTPLIHIEGDRFLIANKETMTFVRNELGRITALRIAGGGFLFVKDEG